MTRVALQAETKAGMLLLVLAASHTSCYLLMAITLQLSALQRYHRHVWCFSPRVPLYG